MGGGTAMLVSRDTDHYAEPVSVLQHLDSTAIYVVLANRPVKFVAAYLSPTRPLKLSALTACLSVGSLILMAEEINAKHRDWNSRLTTERARSSLITPTEIPAWSMIRTHPPQIPTIATRPPMSWTLFS
jgi:hypothetical protein